MSPKLFNNKNSKKKKIKKIGKTTFEKSHDILFPEKITFMIIDIWLFEICYFFWLVGMECACSCNILIEKVGTKQ